MKRLSSFVLAIVFGLQPVCAFAVFETPSGLFDSIRMDPVARTIKGEVHWNVEGSTWVSLWFDVAQEGSSLETGKANVKMTIDVVNTDENMKGRFRAEARVIDQKLFIKLDTAEGTFENGNVMATANVVLKKWIQAPIEMQGRDIVDEVDDVIDSSFANEMFDLAHLQTALGHSYTLTLKQEVLQDIIASMPGGSADFSIKIDTNLGDLFQTGKITAKFISDTLNVHGTATMQRSKTPLNIVVPADVISVEELYQSLPAAMGLNPADSLFGVPVSDFPSDEWEVPEAEEPVVPSAKAGIKPSRRTIRESVRTLRQTTRPTSTLRKTSSSTLDDHGLVIGRSDAPVTIVEFGDYECPFCANHFALTMPKIMKEYVDTGKVRYIFRNYPLSFHPGAMPAAIAVECALEQGNLQAVTLHDVIYTAVNGGLELNMESIQDWAKNIPSIDSAEFLICTNTEATADLVDADIEEGTDAGVGGTPSFFILGPNGEKEQITGAYPIDEFRRVIDTILGE